MKERLSRLYALQKVDSSLNELQEMKGDLPETVKSLESRLGEMGAAVKALDETITGALIERDRSDLEAAELREKIERDKDRQYHVRSNREYDALTKEIDEAVARSSELEKAMDTLADKARLAREDKEKLEEQRREVETELMECRKELEVISKSTEEEELNLQHEREKLVHRIKREREEDLREYERIRPAKGGVAVVPIRRGACAGCYSAVPAQRILEIRASERIYSCEHCGRILIPDEVAENSADVR